MCASFTQTLQRALQLDFFSDLFGNTPEVKPQDRPPKRVKSLTPDAAPNATIAPEPDALRKRQVLIQNEILEYELRRSKRRSIGFLIGDGGLRITAPRWVTISAIEQAIHEKQNWIIARLREKRERIATRAQSAMCWEDGGRLPYRGAHLTLRLVPARKVTVIHDAELATLTIAIPPEADQQKLKDAIKKWLQSEAMQVFNARLPIYAARLGVQYQSMNLSSAGTRWGSCTSQGKIRLNWRLIHFSDAVIDYVVAHELAHLIEMNHSANFWATVESAYPDYLHAKQKLRRHAAADLPVF